MIDSSKSEAYFSEEENVSASAEWAGRRHSGQGAAAGAFDAITTLSVLSSTNAFALSDGGARPQHQVLGNVSLFSGN